MLKCFQVCTLRQLCALLLVDRNHFSWKDSHNLRNTITSAKINRPFTVLRGVGKGGTDIARLVPDWCLRSFAPLPDTPPSVFHLIRNYCSTRRTKCRRGHALKFSPCSPQPPRQQWQQQNGNTKVPRHGWQLISSASVAQAKTNCTPITSAIRGCWGWWENSPYFSLFLCLEVAAVNILCEGFQHLRRTTEGGSD